MRAFGGHKFRCGFGLDPLKLDKLQISSVIRTAKSEIQLAQVPG